MYIFLILKHSSPNKIYINFAVIIHVLQCTGNNKVGIITILFSWNFFNLLDRVAIIFLSQLYQTLLFTIMVHNNFIFWSGKQLLLKQESQGGKDGSKIFKFHAKEELIGKPDWLILALMSSRRQGLHSTHHGCHYCN